jgi:hypothetical protein
MVLLQETYGALLVLTRNSSAPCIDYYVLLYLYPARQTVLLFYHTFIFALILYVLNLMVCVFYQVISVAR